MAETVRAMFARIAPRYDRANTMLSWGLHRAWRRRTVAVAEPPRGGAVLDVATGTGDLAFEFRHAVGSKGSVVGVDFCAPMLQEARAKAQAQHLRVEFQEADALALPFEPAVFDVASIAFGVRNVDDPRRCLEEMARVVRPGGRVVVLEFGQPKGVMRAPYAAYSRVVLPIVGGLMTGQKKAYDYLRRTSASFPSGERFLELMESTERFCDVRAHSLSGGIAYIYVGIVGQPTAGAPGVRRASACPSPS